MKTTVLPKLFFLISIVALCLRANAADLLVSNYGGDIQAAVDAAASNDTVLVEDGTYVLTNEIYVSEAITVRGINGPDTAIVDGGGSTRCFYLEDEGCIIADLTIRNGYEEGSGAGIYCDYSRATVSNCVVSGNVADPDAWPMGGGLYGGTAIDCIFENNEALDGGGAAYSILVRCRVQGNSVEGSGGGLAYGSATNCIIVENNANGTSGGEAEVAGGGLYESDAFTCAISGNETTGNGGGACYGSLYNCTITANTAGQGGGVCRANEIYNCIVWGNTMTGSAAGEEPSVEESAGEAALAGEDYALGSDLYECWDVYYTCAPEFDNWGEGNITDDPLLVTYSHISSNSPCIGAGTNAYASGVDIDAELWLDPPAMGCDENHGAGTLIGELNPSIDGPERVATDYPVDFFFQVDGIPALVVASIENVGSITNPVGAVEALWTAPGTNDVVLTAYNETYPGGVSVTQQVVVVSAAASAIHVVAVDGDDADDGSSWALAKETVQAGIDAQDILGGWVLVADGTYTNEMFPVLLDRSIVVKGTNAIPSAIIDADESDTCVAIPGSGVLQGFVIQNGYAWEGGGIFCGSPDATVRNCIIRENYAEGSGSGMYGGTAINCEFYMNEGSALESAIGIGCVLANNEGGSGAASYCTLHNCTIVGNDSNWGAGGAYSCTLFNCIVYYNTCGNPYGGEDISYSESEYCCSPDVEHGWLGNITNAPQLVNSSHLAAGSPCQGAGDAAYALETDIDGEAWLSPPSIGCDEYHGAGTITGEIVLAIDGITHCAEGSTVEYSFTAMGPVAQVVADFGDGTSVTNPIAAVEKTWGSAGMYDLVLTAWNDTYPTGTSITQQVTVVSLEASTIYVALDGSDANDGSSWALAKQTIQGGVDAQTIYGGRVLVSNGTYSASTPVTVDAPVKLVGFGGRDETLIDGGGTNQCLLLSDSHSYVEGFCITNAYGNYGGGVVCNSDNGPVITNCLITGCDADRYGGGGYYGTYIDCIISGNTASWGGGLSDAVAVDCLISGNEATKRSNSNGGGANSCFLNRCVIKDNETEDYGGGAIYGESHSCLFIGNHAWAGGGVRYGYHYNATIVSNTCTYYSGAGGAHYPHLLNNSIVYGNLRYSNPSDITGYSYNYHHTCSPDVTHGENGCIIDDPMFADPANGDYRLAAGSPCIDAGNNAFVMVAVDLDGNSRIVGGTVDMGAYEYDTTGPLDSDGDGMPDADELIAGTGIYDSNDWFRVESISNTGSGTIIGWDAVVDRLYSVYWTDDLVDEPFVLLTNGLTIGSFEDTMHTDDTNGFYFIIVELAP